MNFSLRKLKGIWEEKYYWNVYGDVSSKQFGLGFYCWYGHEWTSNPSCWRFDIKIHILFMELNGWFRIKESNES